MGAHWDVHVLVKFRIFVSMRGQFCRVTKVLWLLVVNDGLCFCQRVRVHQWIEIPG